MTFLDISSEARGETWVIHLKGFLDVHTHEILREAIRELLAKGRTRLVLDMEQLTYVGSSGIEVILSTVQPLRDKGGDMVLSGMSPKIYKVFDLLGLTALLTLRPTLDEGLAVFKG
jgi:anti-sigma B factor antagonist